MKQELLQTLNQIHHSGTFTTSGTIHVPLPGLVVAGVGMIALPLQPAQAEAIIAECEQAPYGRGEETILDTSVRNTWQLAPEFVKLQNPAWEVALKRACADISISLGLGEEILEASLYKLLIYREGCFFLPHRDTEKEKNMCATMVVSLPSFHEGGELIVSHRSESYCHSFAGARYLPEYAAFYADCLHEVKPVLSGYRLCLVYNLSVAKERQQPRFTDLLQTQIQLNEVMARWSQSTDDIPLCAYLLEHAYTEENLSLSNLKNGDYARASALLEAARESHCIAYLCLVTFHETGSGTYTGNYRHGWSYGAEIDEDEYEEYSKEETRIYAHRFIGVNGELSPLDEIDLDEEELIANVPLTEGPGQELSISEASGNAGATRDLWYHRGAVIFWPERLEGEIAIESNLSWAMDYAQRWIDRRPFKDPQEEDRLLAYVTQLVEKRPSSIYSHEGEMVALLCNLGVLDLAKLCFNKGFDRYIRNEVMVKALCPLIRRFSLDAWNGEIEELARRYCQQASPAKALDFLLTLAIEFTQTSGLRELMVRHLRIFSQQLPNEQANLPSLGLYSAFCTLVLIDDRGEVSTLLAALFEPTRDFVRCHYGPALVSALAWCDQRSHSSSILEPFVDDFFKRAGLFYVAAPEPFVNLVREKVLNCGCFLCQETNRFLSDPQRATLRFEKQLKRDLVHLEEEIEKQRADLSLSIIRLTSKFGGELCKTDRSYQTSLKEYKEICQLRDTLSRQLTGVLCHD